LIKRLLSVRLSWSRNNKELQAKEKEIGKFKESDDKNRQRIIELEKERDLTSLKLDESRKENTKLQNQISIYLESEDQKQKRYEDKVNALNQLKQQLDDDRIRLQNEREEEIKKKFEEMKFAWKNHENNVLATIEEICTRHNIEYVNKEKVPFRGKPDNTILIAGEYVIFDAKSPQGDDLTSFQKYIKDQTEKVKKYTSEDRVKKDVFLVVPSNTIETIKSYYYNMVDYRVYVVSVDSLEPIILNLLIIEAYEFAEQLSPEEREHICRIIGKFAHATKRKIQIDSYLNSQFFGSLNDCNILPEDMLIKVIEFERSDKLNPPIERRKKEISIKEIKKHITSIDSEATLKNINTKQDLQLIDHIRGYNERYGRINLQL
jgi:hypothetical protein